MGATDTIIGTDMIEGQGEILGAGGEHAPHIASITTTKLAERRVTEHHVIGVAGSHRLTVETLEGLVETGDQGAVDFTHGQTPCCAMGIERLPAR
ncbi:hypothetical protein D3C78_1192620 [compost metagenome]